MSTFHLLTNPAQLLRKDSNLRGEGEVREAGRLLRRNRLQGYYRVLRKPALRPKTPDPGNDHGWTHDIPGEDVIR